MAKTKMELTVGVRADGQVVMEFGLAVQWVAIAPDQAEALADLLREKAQIARVAAEVAGEQVH